MPFRCKQWGSDSSACYSSTAVFLFFAIALVVPSGYSLGAALLFLGGLAVLARRGQWPVLDKQDKALLLVFSLFFFVWIMEIVLDNQSSSRFDKPVRIVCAGIALLWLLRHPPRPACFWGGIATGAVLVGTWAGWQKLVLHVDRAGGHTHTIQFGNISMLLGMLCLAGAGWAWIQQKSLKWTVFLLAGFAFGALGSLFSGSRGGWIGVPFILLVVAHGYRQYLSRKVVAAASALFVVAALSVFLIPKTGVQSRIQAAVSDVMQYYQNGVTATSLGARFEMWRLGGMALRESPLVGLGQNGLRHFKSGLIEEGRVAKVTASFDHLHNEYVDTAARRGLLGLLTLLALYLVPLFFFTEKLRQAPFACKPYAVAGSILCVSYLDFGISQTFLSHNSGVMFFFFGMVIIWSLMKTQSFENPRIAHVR